MVNESSEKHIISLVEDLLVGSGAVDFRQLEKLTDVFCPFEAIGMVSQEIRHSNFLAYLLDENNPHIFGTKILEQLLSLIADRTEQTSEGFSKLDLHFMDISNATISREWRNIDLLLEIPRIKSSHDKGLIITIELKIYATESKTQLSRYKQIVDAEYPDEQWDKIFVFLTLNEDEPSEANTEHWTPIGLPELIIRLEQFVEMNNFQDDSVYMLSSYIKMMRRNFMPHLDLETVARKIWAKHRLALDALLEYYPDLRGEVMDILHDNRNELAAYLSKETGFKIASDTSYHTNLRFGVVDWDQYSEMKSGDGTWLDSDRLMAIELMNWGDDKIRMSFVVGPGDQDVRKLIYDGVLEKIAKNKIKIGRKTPVESTKHKHLSAEYLLTDKRYFKAQENEELATELVEEVKINAAKFLNEHLKIYDKIVREAVSD